MNVKIIMDRAATSHNRKLITFLLSKVNMYRKNLRMQIITVPKKEHKSLDEKITALPAAYVGTNIIIGYKDVMRAITIAYNKTIAQGNADPVQEYWEKSITHGMDSKESGGKTENENISKRFTAATKRRGDSYARRAPPKPGKKGSAASTPSPMKSQSNKAPTTTAAMISANASSSEFISQDDPMAASNLEKDPLMAAFWRNNEVTPGT
jgi:hypothetical protein